MPTVSEPGHSPNDGTKNRKKRNRVFTSNDRASHRVIEKQRRESLNQNFLDLARLIPNLAPVSRLSKSLIVKECVEYLRAQRQMRLAAACEVRKLVADYDKVLVELNIWRTLYSQEEMQSQQSQPMSDALFDLLKVDQEKFGTFPAGFGENGAGNEDQDGVSNDKKHTDGDIDAPNDTSAELLLESDLAAQPSHVEADPFFSDFLPRAGNNPSSGNFPSNFSQNILTVQQDNESFNSSSFVSPGEELLALLNSQNPLPHQTLRANPNFSTINTNHVPHEDTFLPPYLQDTPTMEGINHQHLSYETAPQHKIPAHTMDQLSLSYAISPNYTIEDITA